MNTNDASAGAGAAGAGGEDDDTVNDVASSRSIKLPSERVAGDRTENVSRMKRSQPHPRGEEYVDDDDDDDDAVPDELESRIREGVNKRSRPDMEKEWSDDEDEFLIDEVNKCPDENDWEEISRAVSQRFHRGRTALSCCDRNGILQRREATLQRSRNKELEAQLSASRQDTKRERQEKECSEQGRLKLEREKKNHSFESLLCVREGQFVLVRQGPDGSADGGKHKSARAVETTIPIKMLESNDGRWTKIREMSQTSWLLKTFVDETAVTRDDLAFHRAGYFSEADVASFVKSAAEDAVTLLGALRGGQYKHLKMRMERNLFSFRPDVMVVLLQDTPFFAVEVKKPLPKNASSQLAVAGTVWGQVYDYAELLQAYGLPKSYVIISTFEESAICWLDKSELGWGHSVDKHAHDSNDESPNRKLDTAAGTEKDKTPDPPSLIESPPEDVGKPTDEMDQGNFFKPAAARNLCRTKIYKPHNLVWLLYVGISKAMDENSVSTGRLPKIYHLKQGKMYTFPKVLRTGPNLKYGWTGIRVKVGDKIGISKGRRSFSSNKDYDEEDVMEYFIIGTLGYGSTSNVFQAVNSYGRVVAIKVYVKANDGILDQNDLTTQTEFTNKNDFQDQKDFKESARQAMEREKDRLLSLYGELLKHKVRTVQLFNGLHCLVMPFFLPVAKKERANSVQKIESVLKEHFVPNNVKYDDGDIRWRHVGIYVDDSQKDHIILYDLADLQPLGDDDSMVDRHCQILKERCEGENEEKEDTHRQFVGGEVGT